MKPSKETILTPNLAAHFLASQIGDTPELWVHRLANWRRPGRGSARRASVEAIELEGGQPGYAASALEKFAGEEHSRRVLVTGRPDGASPRAVAVPHLDGTDKPHVRVSFAIGAVSQSVFAIDPATARSLASMLSKSAAIVDRVAPAAEEHKA